VNQQAADELVELTATIVSAYVANNALPMAGLPDLLLSVHASLEKLAAPGMPAPDLPIPAVPIRKSVTQDYIISLEDGRKLKTLRRYLSARFGMTPQQYRAKWGLPADYPMVAPSYAAKRSSLAKTIGLGRKDGVETKPVRSTGKRGRPAKA